MSAVSGGCLCGKVRYTAEDVDPELHVCHCGMCRKWGGGPAFAATTGKVEFDGEENIGVYVSSAWAERGFCKLCGSNLFYRLKSGDYFMSMGTFDDPTPFKVVGEIYVDHQPPGYRFAGDLSRLTEAEFLDQFGSSE